MVTELRQQKNGTWHGVISDYPVYKYIKLDASKDLTYIKLEYHASILSAPEVLYVIENDTNPVVEKEVVNIFGHSFISLTTAEKNALNTSYLFSGIFIFNSDRGVLEYYDGDVWLASNCIKMKNSALTVLTEGMPVILIMDSPREVTTSNIQREGNIIGVVVDGGNIGDWVTVAITGIANVYMQNTTKSDNKIYNESLGKAFGDNQSGRGYFARAIENRNGQGLVKCIIIPKEIN